MAVSTAYLLFITFAFANNWSSVNSLFPTVCMVNATLPDAVCCPLSADTKKPCGGPQRGVCTKLTANVNLPGTSNTFSLPVRARVDDRIAWPLRFFTYACKCEGNYGGAACDRCKPGYKGANCMTPSNRIRRNILKLNVNEQRMLRDIFKLSKMLPSSMSVLDVQNNQTSDPTTRKKLRFQSASIFDYLVYLHYYASRSTMVDETMQTCGISSNAIDYCHQGPLFPVWHRQLLIIAEDEFARIALEKFNKSDFSLPYWDWTGKTTCEICTPDLFEDFRTRSYKASSSVACDANFTYNEKTNFKDWILMCPQSGYCAFCDLMRQKQDCRRKQTLARAFNSKSLPLPTQGHVNITMATTKYDSDDGNLDGDNNSFRNSLEGYANFNIDEQSTYMHNFVHNSMVGTMIDAKVSTNDPAFFLHHCFIDKLYELWLRSRTEEQCRFPCKSRRFGHSCNDTVVPYFPPVHVKDIHVLSTKLGYTYDDNKAGIATIIQKRF